MESKGKANREEAFLRRTDGTQKRERVYRERKKENINRVTDALNIEREVDRRMSL